MKDLEPNKVFAAILVAGIVASLSGFVAFKLVNTAPLKTNAFKIEGVASAGGAAPVEEKAQPILGLIAAADPARGQQIAKVCSACHIFDKGGPNGLGPNLWGVVGRPKGSHPGFDYSDGMKKKGGAWTYADLNKFIYKPKAFVDGTKMSFMGLKKPDERAAVIAWLRTLSDSPLPEPTAAEIAAEKADLAPAGAKGQPEPKTSTAPASGKPKPETAPDKSEIGTPSGAISTGGAKTTVKPLNGSDATAATPEGNGGTGIPENSATVKQGSKPARRGADKTPAEKADDKLPGQKTSQAKAPAGHVTNLPRPQIMPVDTRGVEQNSGAKDQQGVTPAPANNTPPAADDPVATPPRADPNDQ